MALNTEDYLLIVNSIMDAVALKEQNKAQELINEKLDELYLVTFKCDAEKQKTFVIIIARLKMAQKKILYKADNVGDNFRDTWILLSEKIDKRIESVKKEKARHACSHL